MQQPLLNAGPSMTAHEFIAKWHNVQFGEKQASQEMFLDICKLVGHASPVAYGNADVFTFEKWVPGGFAGRLLGRAQLFRLGIQGVARTWTDRLSV